MKSPAKLTLVSYLLPHHSLNKYDLNENNCHQIEDTCEKEGITVIAKIPFDNVVTEALIRGLPVMEYSKDKIAREIEMTWEKIVRESN